MGTLSSSRRLHLLVVLFSAPMIASAAGAELALPDATYTLNCDGGPVTVPVPGELPCSRATALVGPPTWEGTRSGIVETYVGVPEFDPALPADVRERLETELGFERFILLGAVQMEATLTTTVADDESEYSQSESVYGTSQLDFAVGIEELKQPPYSLDEVPVKIRVVGEAYAAGDPDGCSAKLVVGGAIGVQQWEINSPGSLPVDVEIATEWFTVGEALTFTKFVECHARTVGVPGWIQDATASASCLAVIDPVFELDQAKLDEIAALLGVDSFPLDEYFAIRYSPNMPIPPPVAVPIFSHAWVVVSLCVALVAAGWMRVRIGTA